MVLVGLGWDDGSWDWFQDRIFDRDAMYSCAECYLSEIEVDVIVFVSQWDNSKTSDT